MTPEELMQIESYLLDRKKPDYELSKRIMAIIEDYNRQQADIEELEAEYEKIYEQAEADILGNLPQGGASCHWCIDKHKAYAIKEFVDDFMKLYSSCKMSESISLAAVVSDIKRLAKKRVGDAE